MKKQIPSGPLKKNLLTNNLLLLANLTIIMEMSELATGQASRH